MPTLTVGDLLDRVERFEQRLEAYYADMRDRSTSDGVRLLTYWLARHRHHLRQVLANYTEDQLAKIRRFPLHYDDTDFNVDHAFEGTHLPDDASGRDLLEKAIGLVEGLMRFYRWMTAQTLSPEAAGVFASLLNVERQHIVELKKMQAMDYF